MDEDLLGYLLDALEPQEMRRVEERLRVDRSAREALQRLERSLRPLEESRKVDDSPPSDLVARTLASLPPLSAPASVPTAESRDWQPRPVVPVGLSPMGRVLESASGSSRGWVDWFAAALAAAVLLGLLLPALAEGRFEARRVACQNQLRELGTAITQFVMRSEQARLPAVAERGPEAFAGVYAVRLHDAGLLDDSSLRWCPSLGRPNALAGQLEIDSTERGVSPSRQPRSMADWEQLISVENLHRAPVNQLQTLQQLAGGHYAYTLGVVDGHQYGAPRYQGRSSFAVMSDAPLGEYSPGGLAIERIGHGGRGINVLYESGEVRFVSLEAIELMPDHPLLNLRGEVEAGVNIDDAVLAPSWRGPFLHAPQR